MGSTPGVITRTGSSSTGSSTSSPQKSRSCCAVGLPPRPRRRRERAHLRRLPRRARRRCGCRARRELVGVEVGERARLRQHEVGDAALARDDLLDLLVDGAGAHQPVADDGLGLADAPRPVAGLVLDRRVPPPVVEHDVVGGGEVEPGAAGLERQHQRGRRRRTPWKRCTISSRHAARQAAVVALDRLVEPLGEVGGELHAPLGEVREDQHALAGGEHRLDDLLEPGQLAASDPSSGGRRPGTPRGGRRSA